MITKNTLIMKSQDADGLTAALDDVNVDDFSRTPLPKGMASLTFRTTNSLEAANQLVSELNIPSEEL